MLINLGKQFLFWRQQTGIKHELIFHLLPTYIPTYQNTHKNLHVFLCVLWFAATQFSSSYNFLASWVSTALNLVRRSSFALVQLSL